MAKKYFNVVKSDEWYTPKFAVEMIAKHLKPHSVIWCPFDGPDSWFVKVFSELGHLVYFSHLKIGIGSNLNYESELDEYLDLKGLEPDFFDNQIEIIRNLGGGHKLYY